MSKDSFDYAGSNPISSGFPLVIAFVAGLVALAVCIFGGHWAESSVAVGFVKFVACLVPEVNIAAQLSNYPRLTGLMMATQWSFAPIYIFVWVRRESPWGKSVRNRLTAVTPGISFKRRVVGFVVITCALLCWAVSNLGLELLPTFYSGQLFSPDGVFSLRLLRTATRSSLGMAFVAWLSPIIEVVMAWIFLACVLNTRFVWKLYR